MDLFGLNGGYKPDERGARTESTYLKLDRLWRKSVEYNPAAWPLIELVVQLKRLGPEIKGREFIIWLSLSPLVTAPRDVRIVALRKIDKRADWLKVRNGGLPLDDPLPHQPPSVYILAREILSREGRL